MNIAIVGPGYMPIPSNGWGAVEIVIWEYYQRLVALGHNVTIINHYDYPTIAKTLKENEFDFIWCCYDDHVAACLNSGKPFCTTLHYGMIKSPRLWSPGYWNIMANALYSPGMISLSPEIKSMIDRGYSNYSTVLRNGASCRDIRFNPNPSKDCIFVGKIESRKRQADTVNYLWDADFQTDFVGPIHDSNFVEKVNCKYIGTWTRKELHEKLSDYKVLVLLSDGEAAPLVVPEALAAGLSVVLTKTAMGNLDEKPFIYECDIPPTNIKSIISKALNENAIHRQSIREYAEQRFDWDVIVKEFLDKIQEFQAWHTKNRCK